MAGTRRTFSKEFKEELCKEVIDTARPVRVVAESYCIGTETLRSWVVKYKREHDRSSHEPPANLNADERARLKQLEREISRSGFYDWRSRLQ